MLGPSRADAGTTLSMLNRKWPPGPLERKGPYFQAQMCHGPENPNSSTPTCLAEGSKIVQHPQKKIAKHPSRTILEL